MVENNRKDKMRNIIIVECRSTVINFIEDIINRGYAPVVLECNYGDSDEGAEYKSLAIQEYDEIKYDFDMIYEQETYEETLKIVEKYDPLLVLPGNERGVILASKLSYDLNLICNPIENLDAMTLKHEMQNKIAEYGLRSIRGKVAKSLDEAIKFYDSEELKEVILKPIYSCGSASVKMASDKQEMIDCFSELMTKNNVYGEELNEILIQECIKGDEYIVNTVSCEGRHRVTLVWKYNKVLTDDGAIVYDTCETVNELDISEAEMIEYAYDVADALGIQYGPIHGEYMIDENGPVLIEVNCRPCGGHMPSEFLERISGQHETDSILDAYLKPDRFKEKQKRKYELYAHGALKFFTVPKDMVAVAAPMHNISIRLDSHYKINLDKINEEDKKTYFKTDDVDSACGIVYLVNKDNGVLQSNINYLRKVERHAFSLILTEENTEKKHVEYDIDEIREMLKKIDKYGNGILVTDQIIDDCVLLQITPKQIEDVGGKFDFIIINLNESITENNPYDAIKMLLDSFLKVKLGGLIFIPKTTYTLFNGGRKGIEALIKGLNYKIELPPDYVRETIIASRR